MENLVVSFVPQVMWLLNVVRWVIVVFGSLIIVWLSMINTKTASWLSLVGRTEDKVASHTEVQRKPRCCSQLLISLFSYSLRVSQHIPKCDGFLSLMQMFSISSFAFGSFRNATLPAMWNSLMRVHEIFRRVVRDPGHLDEKNHGGFVLGVPKL